MLNLGLLVVEELWQRKRLKDVPAVYSGDNQEKSVQTLFDVAIAMGHGLDGADSVRRAAMAVDTVD